MTTIHAPTFAETQSQPHPRFTLALGSNALALVLTGLFAGFFGTYSFSVVRGLAIVDDTTYVAAFQGINSTIQNLEFALVFFGALPAIALAVFANRNDTRANKYRAIAAALVLATIAITFVGNVPLNNDLALVDAFDGQEATSARATFESTWNQLNLARTATSALAFIAMATSALVRR